MLLTAIFWLLAAAACGSMVYSGIALCGALRFLRHRRKLPASGSFTPPVSLLKPLCGVDRELEQNLESFCRQEYPAYEILFSVREEADPAVAVVRRLENAFPQVPVRLLVLGPPRYLNAKVHGLEAMMEAARHDILVISDSDVRVAPDYLRGVVAPLAESNVGPTVGMVTCISRGVPGKSLWSLLEAMGMNTHFIPGVLSAWALLGLQFSLGPTMVIRKRQVEELGGFGRLGDYLADDFVLGERVAERGHKVALAGNIPDHLVCNESLRDSLRHRLRWERSSRRSRPAGYVGQLFMHSLPLALAAWACAPSGSLFAVGLVLSSLAARALLAWVTAWRVLRDPTFLKYGWLLPAQDLLSFFIWLRAFFGREIEWRGARFRVVKGGKLEPLKPRG